MVLLPIDILVLHTIMKKQCDIVHNNEKGHVFVCVRKSGHTAQEVLRSAGQSNWHLINWGLRSGSLPF